MGTGAGINAAGGMKYQIRDCRLADLRAILPVLRDGDLAEARAAGVRPRHLLIDLWGQSFMSRCAMIDGVVAAVWGCVGNLAGSEGFPWLFTSTVIERAPITFFKEAGREIRALLETRTVLETGVLRSYDRSLRFWQKVGFAPAEEYTCGGLPFLKLRMERR